MSKRSRPSPTDRTHVDNWHGSYYELAIKLGSADDARLQTALAALWEAAQLGEPFRRDGSTANVSVADLVEGHLNGVANIPGLGATLASVILVREGSYETGQTIYGNDWLDLCLPLGALGNLDERVGAYPFDDARIPACGGSRLRTGSQLSLRLCSRRSRSSTRSPARKSPAPNPPSSRRDGWVSSCRLRTGVSECSP